jgi:hypothetical protein
MNNDELKEEIQHLRSCIRSDNSNIYSLISEAFKNDSEIKDLLNEIKIQTIKTNGRVNRLEERECEARKIIEDLRKDTEDVRFYSSRPKVVKLILLGVFMLGASGGAWNLAKESHKIINYVKEIKSNKRAGSEPVFDFDNTEAVKEN